MSNKRATPANLLVEIGTEELPPKALKRLGQSFGEACRIGLDAAELLDDVDAKWRWFATPRRLGVWISKVRVQQPDRVIERRGPALQAAFGDDGEPTQAALGFAQSCNVPVEKLQRLKTGKGEWLAFRQKQKGQPASAIIPECINEAIRRLPIPKRMRWGDLDAEFVRPVHWLVILHGRDVIKANLLATQAERITRGHRFHYPKSISLAHADRYEQTLKDRGYVVADFDARRELIVKQIDRLAAKAKGVALVDDELLDEVTGLVEWPVAILGQFDKAFLDVPSEALVSSMRDHQKYFPVTNRRGALLPYFVTISNIKSTSPARVRVGNERVLRARLADARFFWDTDRKQALEARTDALKDVLFHAKLGSVADKTERMMTLAAYIAERLSVDKLACQRAARLSKADLVTEMVGEFPELQGVMGRYYAEHDGEAAEVSRAIQEHYRPRFAGDNLPTEAVGQVVALADKIDSIVGIFVAGEEPSGDKDPYGLRRAALGVLRILIEGELDLDLLELLGEAAADYRTLGVTVDPEVTNRVFDFMLERLRAYYGNAGFGADEITAVASRRPTQPWDFHRRLNAVAAFRRLPAAANLAAANKRIKNILRQANDSIPEQVNQELLQLDAERELIRSYDQLRDVVITQFDQRDYPQGLTQLANLKEPVDRFFDDVMVMVDDAALRQNRLALLNQVQQLFLRVADISQLQIAGANNE